MKFLAKLPQSLAVLVATAFLAVTSFIFTATPAAAATFTVKMGSDNGMLVFEPKSITVKPGDTVRWEMNKVGPHNAVFDASGIPGANAKLASGLSRSKLLFSAGEAYEVTIPADAPAGKYSYYCQPHRGAGMVGEVVVSG